MKLKYKKMIIMISMCTMGIGLVTFSINGSPEKPTKVVEENVDVMVAYDAQAVATIEDQDLLSATITMPTPIPTPEPTIIPEIEATMKTQVVVDVLEKNAYKDVNKLINKYLNAKLTKDVKNFKLLVNDVSSLDMKDIERKTKYIEEYQNLTCFSRKGPEEGTYIVYAYHEVKFTSIDTLAPAMNEFYVKTDKNGDPFIYLGEIDKDTETYLNDVRKSDNVMDLIYTVNEKFQKAVDGDDALAEFYLKLEESQSVTKND